MTCEYCQTRKAVHKDHVIPKYLQKRLQKAGVVIPPDLAALALACMTCNLNKGTRKLVPVSWEKHIPALQKIAPGPWRTWNGDPSSPVFTEVHK